MNLSRRVQVDNSTLEYSANQIRIKDGGVTAAKHATGLITALGTPVAKTVNTVYQATVDTFVYAVNQLGGSGLDFELLSDASNPPTTKVQWSQFGAGSPNHVQNMGFLVKAGNYYKIPTGTGTTLSYFAQPLG